MQLSRKPMDTMNLASALLPDLFSHDSGFMNASAFLVLDCY